MRLPTSFIRRPPARAEWVVPRSRLETSSAFRYSVHEASSERVRGRQRARIGRVGVGAIFTVPSLARELGLDITPPPESKLPMLAVERE